MPCLGVCVRNLLKSTRGAAVIEAAIALPFLAVVVMGTIDVARYGAALLRVQQGLNRGLEMATMVGPTATLSTIEDEVEAQAGSGSSATAVLKQFCNDVETASCPSGEPRQVIQIQVTSSFQPTFVMSAVGKLHTLDANGKFTVTETGYVRVI